MLARDDYRCQAVIAGRVHGVYGNQVDHIRRGDDHHPDNLQTLCDPCHAAKSAREGGAASAQARRARGLVAARPPESHPGMRP